MATERRTKHRRNEKLERLLQELSEVLAPAERMATAGYRMPARPPIFVIGAPRSGTTILMQWLAAGGRVAYPTNLLSRFYASPWLGAKIQQLLTDPDYDFQGELFDLRGSVTFESTLGKTKGALAPNEFWYFWRRFLPNDEPRYLGADEEAAVDGAGLAAGLAALDDAFGKPFALKAMIVQYNVPAISRVFERALFLHVRRELFYNAQSLLEAREEYYGSRGAWYSVKPREYESLAHEDCFTQVAGQVHFTNAAIAEGLASIDPARSMVVDYERFCESPATIYAKLVEKLAAQGCAIDDCYDGPERFESTNTNRCTEADRRALEQACATVAARAGGR